MTVFLAADHAGFALKERVKRFLSQRGVAVKDFGAFTFDEQDDYPDFITPAAEALARNPDEDRALLFGGSGQGEAMAANRVRGVRAAVYYGGNAEIVRLSREHNDANALSLGARFVDEDEALRAVESWLGTPFSGDARHQRRIGKY